CVQALGGLEDASGRAHVLADQDDPLVALELVAEGPDHRLAVRDRLAHAGAAQTWSKRWPGSGSGQASARSTAPTTASAAASRTASTSPSEIASWSGRADA